MDTKENILANLYAIRGGLSLISQHTDQIKAIEIEQNRVKRQNIPYPSISSSAVEAYNAEKEKWDAFHQKYKESKAKYEEWVRKTTKGTKEYSQEANKCQAQIKEVQKDALEWARLNMESPWDCPSDSFIVKVLFKIYRVVLFPVTIIKAINCKKRDQRFYDEYVAKHMISWDQWYNDLLALKKKEEANMKALEIKIRMEKDSFYQAEVAYNNAQEEYQKELSIRREKSQQQQNALLNFDNQIQIIAAESKAVKESMNRNFNLILNEADWGNVDLLIYYLETGRAESVKEALQLMDRQIQTNQIVGAISDAHRSLSMTINAAMNCMGQALSKSFSVISSQLSQILQSQRETVSAINANTEATARLGVSMAQAIQESASQQRQAISNQSAATQLTNALLEKSNRTSEDLLHDLRYNQNLWRR